MTVQASTSSPVTPAPLSVVPAAPDLTTADTSNDNLFCMIAEMLGENDKLNREAKPTTTKETIAYIEQALSQSINFKDFDSNKQFWASLKSTLPKDSPLLPYVTGQLNLFTQGSVKVDADSLRKTTDVQNGAPQAQINADIAAIQEEKNITNAKSRNFNLQTGSEASSVLNAVKQTNNTTLTALNQEMGIARLLNAISVNKA
ncbi:MAG: hypothetical protein WA678_00450 [Rhabdochlamydiaceae bacterium]